MKVKAWVKIEEQFTKKYGWKRGVKLLVGTKRRMFQDKSILDMSPAEEQILTRALRIKFLKTQE